MRKTLPLAVIVASLALGGCSQLQGDDLAEKGNDAPSGTTNDDKAHIIEMPEGYPNVATKCSGIPGKRVWVTTGGSGRSLSIEEDEDC